LALAAEGHRVRVAVLRGWIPPGFERWVKSEHRGNIDASSFPEIESIRSGRYPTIPGNFFRRATNVLLDAAVGRLLRTEIGARRPDVILVHTETLAPATVALARKADLPVLVVMHGENTNAAYLSRSGQAQRFRAALGQADRVVIVGEPLRGFAARLSGRDDHVAVVWNGVEPPESRRQVPDPDVAPVEILIVANLQEGKGVDLLLSALGQLRAAGLTHWRLRIIGTGPLQGVLRIQACAEGIDDQVEFLGTMSNSEVFARMAESDVFALPSWRESFGVAYLEAMASGLLAIGVQGQGPAQFISDGLTGMLVPSRDAEVLADRLRGVLTGDRSVWRAMAAAGADHVRHSFTWRSHARNMGRLITEVTALSQGERRRPQ
jgi:glycosyltransferase involved in cell wall biosynthesis